MSTRALMLVAMPDGWPGPPDLMSVSTAAEIEACPRRWLLGAASYPSLWDQRGYPPRPSAASLGGTVVHLALEALTKQFVSAGLSSVHGEDATRVLKELGGFTRVIEKCIDDVLADLARNPRASSLVDHVARTLRGRVADLRASTQSLFVRMGIRARAGARWRGRARPRTELGDGSYSEIEVRCGILLWKGKLDVLHVSDNECEIIDFKAGGAQEKHREQVRTYALLWLRDVELNPKGRAATKLTLAYVKEDVAVEVPSASECDQIARDLAQRRDAAHVAIGAPPGEARPNRENCRYCSVKHLCDEYWRQPPLDGEAPEFSDFDLVVVGRHSATSWDAQAEFCSISTGPAVGKAVLLRAASDLGLTEGARIRIVGAAAIGPMDDGDPFVVSLNSLSEVFVR